MTINLHSITVRELVQNYKDDNEGGVTGYDGRLDIRPPYQREFCYSDSQQQAVMDTVCKGFPLNTMYWVVREMAGLKFWMGSRGRFLFVVM